MNYLRQIIIAFNQLLNAIFGGWADETISSRAHRTDGLLRRAIDSMALLIFRQEDHCAKAYAEERARIQLPPELR